MPVTKPSRMTFILFVKADSFAAAIDTLKVILAEQHAATDYAETFLFDTKTTLTKE